MFSKHRSTNRTIAFFTFFSSLILYTVTMAPTVSFWDSGEFIAVAHGLQVNHPPGAPFYSLMGRLFSMFMPAGYVAASINFISVLCSAFTVMLLYLISVRFIREWKDSPQDMPTRDLIAMYGGSLIGAFTFAVTDTFWFNAVEAEVYAVSMFFTALVVWLALVWSANHNRPNNERWLILIAYLFGIALGIHLLNLLALFFVALIIYFKKYAFGWRSFGIMIALSVASFLLIYPFTIQSIPTIMESITHASYGLIGPVGFIILVVILFSSALYYTHTNNYRTANIIILCYTMILIGYSSYALIFIRSNADPPIDENDPETVESFIDYLEREQYGDTPLLTGHTFDNAQGTINRDQEVFFPRRYSSRSQHLQQYGQYSSDWDYFIDYQLNHMYWRYFAWNFIGRDADIQDASWQSGFTETQHEDNPAHNSYYYIPFVLGLLGMILHFNRDWKRALSVLTLFVFTGIAIIVYLNQTPMEPRERDYAYVGSFFAFSIWIGLGGTGLIKWITEYLKPQKLMAYGMLGILFCASPILMGIQNYHDSDRSTRYVAADYAYNLLNSIAPNAILFTNGDNDTFPLWYLQEVEGVRTDVRIANLSLLNTDWYVKQLRDEWSHESPPLPITLTDKEIEQISNNPIHQPDTVSIPVKKDLLQSAFKSSEAYRKEIGIDTNSSVNIFDKDIAFGIPVDSLDNNISWYYEGEVLGKNRKGDTVYASMLKDRVIINILRNNNWLRPIYFANTVPQSNQLNLRSYFRSEGKTYRVVPDQHNNPWLNPSIFTERLEKFRFREWNRPDTYLDANIRGMMRNYNQTFSNLANKYIDNQQPDSAKFWLSWGHKKLPFEKTASSNPFTTLLYAHSYSKTGTHKPAVSLVNEVKVDTMQRLRTNISDFESMRAEIQQIRNQIRQARRNANLNQKQQLQKRSQQIKKRRGQIQSELSNNIANLLIMQRIYFMADDKKQALTLADQVNQITSNRMNFPESRKANKQEVSNIGF